SIGPSNDGIIATHNSDLQMQHTLVAAVWGTGVQAQRSRNGSTVAKVHLRDCDIRNCYYAGVTLGSDESTVENCRISGAAWHGIRYDDCSPTIQNNLIFANARCGIYASGSTHATIRNNFFWKNEMDAISCWFNNNDTIERN